ncbi:D-alanine--D-alanine ligase [uncultured Parolsenella sp.]|uniref:D-alanine--D-alanine ligase family protein n=1 Tax=uncultured Parolsenella sp. TaxID=2083008 RepID=UPI00342342E2
MEGIESKKVAVLCGGWSDEREVSISSGTASAQALREAGFVQVDLLDIADKDFVHTIADGGYDVAFVALHGRYGEDGCVQGFLELLGIPYTCSSVLASALATDKAMAKDIYREHGIPTPKEVCLLRGDEYDVVDLVGCVGLPCFVKPVSSGSSYGITRVKEASELADAIEEAFKFDTRILVEAAVVGTEITVPVLGNERAQALEAIEVRYETEFYDLSVKYEDPSKHHVIPPRAARGRRRARQGACLQGPPGAGLLGCLA